MRPVSRRAVLGAAASGLALGSLRPAWAHELGPVRPPVPVGKVGVVLAGGRAVQLETLLTGRVTAVQLMFTRCKAMCPMQGALYGGVQKLLAPLPAELKLLSLSIDVKRDTPEAVEAWLQRMGARPERWTGGVLAPADLDAMFELVRGRKAGPDPHTAQAYVFNRRAELAFRSAELPVASSVAEVLQQVAELG